MRHAAWMVVPALAAWVTSLAVAQQGSVETGAQLYQEHCSPCHGERMVSTGAAFDLRELGADERPRFNKSVMEGLNQMPAWTGTIAPAELDHLWAYVRSRARS
jgi:mono/diheme cytochrome c family protein